MKNFNESYDEEQTPYLTMDSINTARKKKKFPNRKITPITRVSDCLSFLMPIFL